MKPLLLALALAAAAPAAPEATEAAPPAQLVFAQRPIVTLRATVIGITPASRVTGIQARLREIVAKPSIGEVASAPIEGGYVITVGGEGAFRVFQADVDPLSEDTLEALRDRATANLKTALAEVAEARSVPRLLRGAATALVATALLVAFVFVLLRVRRWILPRLEEAGRRRVERAGSGELAEQAIEQLGTLLRRGLLAVTWAAALVAFYLWLVGVLEAFPYTRAWGEALGGHLLDALAGIARGFAASLPGLFVVAIIIVAARWLVRVVRRVFDAIERGSFEARGLHPDTLPATRRITSVLVWLFALALAYPFLPGSRSAAFQGVTVFAGLMITIGSGAFVGHLLAGYMIIYSRAFRVGDYVLVGEHEGTVASIGMFTTKIETIKREILSIPNSVVFSSTITNYSLLPAVVIQSAVTIGYGAPWRQVEALLLEAAARTPGIERDPAPFVRQRRLSEFYAEYVVNAFLAKPATRFAVLSALHAEIQDAFNAAGLQIMVPAYESDPPEPIVVPKSRWHPEKA